MTGMRGARGRYSAAGYTQEREERERGELYIASVPAGSAQDELRDLNRAGYQAERPWRETPEPLFEQGTAAAVEAPVSVPRRSVKGRLARQTASTRRDIAACIILGCLVLMIIAAWGQKMVQGVQLQREIELYEKQTVLLQRTNDEIRAQIDLEKNGERIRNLAQNRLGMLRPERAQTRTIYIQNIPTERGGQEQQQESPKLGVLDLMLGLLDMLHIGE